MIKWWSPPSGKDRKGGWLTDFDGLNAVTRRAGHPVEDVQCPLRSGWKCVTWMEETCCFLHSESQLPARKEPKKFANSAVRQVRHPVHLSDYLQLGHVPQLFPQSNNFSTTDVVSFIFFGILNDTNDVSNIGSMDVRQSFASWNLRLENV